MAGAILSILSTAGGATRTVERTTGFDGKPALIDTTQSESADSYWQRRRQRDPDLWVLELDSPHAERFIAETIGGH